MRVRVLGAGFYGCHIAMALLADMHEVEVHELRDRIFAGASGNIPARLHLGAPHYPRSAATQSACVSHNAEFMARYGHLTRAVPINLYAVAAVDSVIDFGAYRRILSGQVEFLTVHDPAEFGLRNVEGAVQVGERHIVCDMARAHFERALEGHIVLEQSAQWPVDSAGWDLTIDCTFCANDAAGIDRYEPCLVLLLMGRTDMAVTIVDGGFPSLYPWDEGRRLLSLSSAKFTPFSKTCRTYGEAAELIAGLSRAQVEEQGRAMVESMAHFLPMVRGYDVVEHRLSIRAMPRSGSDARLVEVVRVGERGLRVRAGKLDAVFDAERQVLGHIAGMKVAA